MPEQQIAVINISKILRDVSLPTIAAIGSATGNVWIAGATAIPAAVAASGTLRSLFERQREEHLELAVPPWWTGTSQSWQTACSGIEHLLPKVMDSVAERLREADTIPTTLLIRRTFSNELASHITTWEIQAQDRGLFAETVTPPILEKSAAALKAVIDPIREDAFARELEKIATTLDQVSAAKPEPATSPTSTSPAVVAIAPSTQAAPALLQQKKLNDTYDVFICYNPADRDEAMKLGKQLKDRGVLPWLDSWRPGRPIIQQQREHIARINSAAVLIGKSGIETFQQMQADAFLQQFVQRGVSLIPVFLEDAPQEPLPIFLDLFGWVDFRQDDPDPMGQLIWGITGERPDF